MLSLRNFSGRAWVLGGIALCFCTASALAQPINDDCSDAIQVGNGNHFFTNVNATTDGPTHVECQFDGETGQDVWYTYTATCTANLTVSTCSQASFDTDIVVYQDCNCGNLVTLGCNDDGAMCGNLTSEVTVPVVAGNCYLIRVGSFNTTSTTGTGILTIRCGSPTDVGACCLSNNTCVQVTSSQCLNQNGSFQGIGAPCMPSPCAGACCLPSGTCIETSADDCSAQGGLYTPGAACTGVACDGACCTPDDVCSIKSPINCAALDGIYRGNGTACTPGLCLVVGADVTLGESNDIQNFGPVGGVRALTIGSRTCNLGDENLNWINDGSPGLAMNAYRLHNGRLEQIGMSWLKTACCAADQTSSLCGSSCDNSGSSGLLGPGCLDVYGAGFNSGQSAKAMRSGVNAFTGVFDPIPGSGSFTSVERRTQVKDVDVGAAFPGAIYILEGHYVAEDDAANNNAMNNASYRRATVNASNQWSFAGDPMQTSIPAIYAWRHHGNGINIADPTIQIAEVDVPAEGRFIFGARAQDIGNGQFRYTYAIYNFNSHRSGSSFTVPIPSGVNVTDIGFHDVDYHSGEPYDNTDWSSNFDGTKVEWSSPATFAQNPNTNALRWGTLYTFWFTADAPPTNANVTLDLFRPGTPSNISTLLHTPSSVGGCGGDLGDVNEDTAIDGLDVQSFTDCLVSGSSGSGNCDCADMDQANGVDLADVSLFTNALLNQ